MAKTSVDSIVALAVALDTPTLRALHTRLTTMCNDRIRQAAAQASLSLHVGQQVQWSGRAGPQSGTVRSIGPKNSVVMTKTQTWRVSNTLLQPAAAAPAPAKGFSFDRATFKYSKGRRGVSLVAPLLLDGNAVGMLYDEPEKIVTPVEFNTPAVRKAFLADARAKGHKDKSDDMAISEYARALSTAAEGGVIHS